MDADSSPELAMSPSPYFPFNGEGWDRRHEAALGGHLAFGAFDMRTEMSG
jgi:hypothetical protein